ncbi:MAG: Carbon monoxide dehydrogenase medium chain [Firmicutes bacterium ADurb.BinA052]|nr:MAG: Carbon monoxide dehydrogenase medium chain [Firmicutes bacterium ADurb.BinA052]
MDTFRALSARCAREAVEMLAAEPGAVLAAGCTDLLVKMKDGKVRPSAVISIDRATDMSSIEDTGRTLWVGAGCTHARLSGSPLAAEKAPLLAAASAAVGSPQIRNRGTLGGNIATASPAGDTIPALIAMGARIIALGLAGQRAIEADRFFLGPGKSELGLGEVILGVEVPCDEPGDVWAFRKLGQRHALSIAIASVAVHAHLERGALSRVAVALGSVAPVVVRARRLEEALEGRQVTAELLTEVCSLAGDAASPITDIRGSREYRLAMVEALAYQALYAAVWPDEVDEPRAKWTAEALGGQGEQHYCRQGQPGRSEREASGADDAQGPCAERGPGRAQSESANLRPEARGGDSNCIRVHVVAFGELACRLEKADATLDLPRGSTVADLYRHIGLADASYVMALVNHRREFDDKTLSDGDEIALMHPVGGG